MLVQGDNKIIAPATVVEGGLLRIQVDSKTPYVSIYVTGQPVVDVPVVGGVVEYRLPATVHGGALIHVSDNLYPNPSSATITVVGGSTRGVLCR